MEQFELNPETLCSWILTSVRSNSISRLTSSSSSLLSQQYGNLALAINVHRKWMTFIIHHNQDQNHLFHTQAQDPPSLSPRLFRHLRFLRAQKMRQMSRLRKIEEENLHIEVVNDVNMEDTETEKICDLCPSVFKSVTIKYE